MLGPSKAALRKERMRSGRFSPFGQTSAGKSKTFLLLTEYAGRRPLLTISTYLRHAVTNHTAKVIKDNEETPPLSAEFPLISWIGVPPDCRFVWENWNLVDVRVSLWCFLKASDRFTFCPAAVRPGPSSYFVAFIIFLDIANFSFCFSREAYILSTCCRNLSER